MSRGGLRAHTRRGFRLANSRLCTTGMIRSDAPRTARSLAFASAAADCCASGATSFRFNPVSFMKRVESGPAKARELQAHRSDVVRVSNEGSHS